MLAKAKLDSRKRCLLAITDVDRWTALHCAASFHSDLAVVELLIREHPLALSTTISSGFTPLQLGTADERGGGEPGGEVRDLSRPFLPARF